jgi:Phage integrase, N-terminal SAM-like domain
MKGHIRERSPGHWAIILDASDPGTGKRKRRWHSFAGTKRAAQIECARLISELQDGSSVDPSRMTVAAFLDQWLEHIKPQVAPRTHERYAEIVRAYLVPALGGVMLSKLQPMAISTTYAGALTSGRRKGAGGFRRARCIICTVPCAGGCYPATRPTMPIRRVSSAAR